MSPRGCGEETGVRKPFSSPPAGTVSFRSPPQPVDLKRRGDGRSETVFVASCRGCVFSPPPSMDLERRGDGRSETVFAASAGKLPDPTSPHLIWRGGKRSKTFFVVSDRQGIKSSSHGPRNRRGGRHSETVCIVVSKTLGGVQRPSLDFFVFLRSFHDLPAILYDHTCCCEGTRKRKILFQACVNESRIRAVQE